MGFVFVTEGGGKPVFFASGSRGNQVVPWIGKHGGADCKPKQPHHEIPKEIEGGDDRSVVGFLFLLRNRIVHPLKREALSPNDQTLRRF